MSESRYVPLEQRAAALIEKGTRAWQEIQRLAMSEDEPLDSVVLLGQELWLPHHETDGSKYRVTLRLAVHFPKEGGGIAEARVYDRFLELEAALSDDQGSVSIASDVRSENP